MTRSTEGKARDYLINEFTCSGLRFKPKQEADRGFDLWLEEDGRPARKIELKATDSAYQRPSNLFERLVFNAEIEKQLFENGESVIARVFMGSVPPRVFLITNAIFSSGAQLTPEARYVLRGKISYANSITELVSKNKSAPFSRTGKI